MIYASWLAEFLLECLGLWLWFRRISGGAQVSSKGIQLLPALLFVRALSDLVTFAIFLAFRSSYAQAYWISHAIQGVLLLLLACQVIGKLFGESWKSLAGALSILGALLVALVYAGGKSLPEKLLGAEASAGMLLCAIICVGVATSGVYLKSYWKWVAAGLLTSVGWDAAITSAWAIWPNARHFYPLGAIAALLAWCWGLWKVQDAGEFRLEVSPRVEPLAEEVYLNDAVN